ncbi:MAG: 50S ribosomal protein L4 [Muribaculaceae bacterium]|nr:50S ribosomal protein L4 [Muribaculaceae bacterium]
MEVAVYNIKGEDTGRKVQLNDAVFGLDELNEHVVYLTVKQYLANQRQGTHKSKERSEISGSTRKLGRQKGGGGARHGDINSPLFHGGGRVFGPKPRNYSFKLNKKVKALARRTALSYKAAQQQIIVVENFTFEAPKTKEMLKVLNNLKISDKKVLLVLASRDKNVILSARNLPNAIVANASDVNTYEILNNKVMVLVEGSVDVLNNLK